MKLIIGLGNPGEKYKKNRHNIGFLVVDKLKTKISNFQFPISNKIQIFKSQNFMNSSGDFVKKLVDQYKLDLSSLWVIHDDLDIKLGDYKIQFGKGPKEHKGLLSIYEKLGTKDFWHVRIGVDPTTPRLRGVSHGEDYVLEDFLPEERIILDKVINEICKKLTNCL